ncbi:MAG: MG2 domain-containing protein [Verrucomicrobiota bacterium]
MVRSAVFVAKKVLTGLIFSFVFFQTAFAYDSFEQAKQEAERFYTEKSYSEANRIYVEQLAQSVYPIPEKDRRWVHFRIADTMWRSEVSAPTSDKTRSQQAVEELHALLREAKQKKDRDRIWIEAQESLGDFFWISYNKNWGQAWQHYQQALNGWAESTDLDTARQRYIGIVRKFIIPRSDRPGDFYHREILPLEIAENFKRIAQDHEDIALANYLLATSLSQSGQIDRACEEFDSAIRLGKKNNWYDDALFQYAMLLLRSGKIIEDDQDEERREPDYARALEMFRKLTSEFAQGETRYWEQAQQNIEEITKQYINVHVSNIFLPESEVSYTINGRNTRGVDCFLWQVDLPRDVRFNGHNVEDWLHSLSLNEARVLKSWTLTIQNKEDFKPFSRNEILGKLPVGAYILEAKSGQTRARELILVTDATLVMKTSGKKVLAYFCDAITGKPIPQATVKLWQSNEIPDPTLQTPKVIWRDQTASTREDGVALFELDAQHRSIFASAQFQQKQAFCFVHDWEIHRMPMQVWRIYVETDRPAYRPKETVQWKITARLYDGQNYLAPAGQTISYSIRDARGKEFQKGSAVLNGFGSFWNSIPLNETLPLGEYRIAFNAEKDSSIGEQVFFRLEEYKLPEFKITVRTPEKDGKKAVFRFGEKIQAVVQAEYYFGGPASEASIDVLVKQKPLHYFWTPKRDFPWFYEDMICPPPFHGDERQIIKRELLKTDAKGQVTVEFDTPRGYSADMEYEIEARVTDASRREVVGMGSVKVSRQRYRVHAEPEGYLHQPADKVTIKFDAKDIHEQPQTVEGVVKITRDYWEEIWISPEGKEVRGHAVPKEIIGCFPYPPHPGWRLKYRGYHHDDIGSYQVKTNAEGEALFTFTPGREGYFRVAWKSDDPGGKPVKTETTVWVANHQTTEIGYRSGPVEIIADKDTFRVGEKAPVMIVTHASDRYVLFSAEGDELLHYQVLHLDGTVKLVSLDIDERYAPNAFLNAVMIGDSQIAMDTKPMVVPPTKNFLKVAIQADKKDYRPGEKSEWTFTTLDDANKPVSAEISFGVVDEAVFYVQQNYASDVRKFFFGEKRPHRVQTTSTLQQKPYVLSYPSPEETPYPMPTPYRELMHGGLMERDAMMKGAGTDFTAMPSTMRSSMSANETLMKMESVVTDDQKKMFTHMKSSGAMAQEKMRTQLPEAMASGLLSPQVRVRSDFRATAHWQPDVKTDATGTTKINFVYPDSTTAWKATARAVTTSNQFGQADFLAKTTQPLVARLQAPRFLVVGDEVTLAGVVNNNTDFPMTVQSKMVVSDVRENGERINGTTENAKPPIEIPPHDQARADWRVFIENAGQIQLRFIAESEKETDAMEKMYPVYERGIEKFIYKAGKIKDADVAVAIDLPNERRSTSVSVQVSPSLALMMLDALPYLANYPYGCVEQTMSRFVPTVIVRKTLEELGLSKTVLNQAFGGIEKTFIEQTHPIETRNLDAMDSIAHKGLEELYASQKPDGSWGWWKDSESDRWMSAYVMWGLALAQKAGLDVRMDVMNRGVEYLRKMLVTAEEEWDLQAWILHALASGITPNITHQISQAEKKALDNLWEHRERLNAYSRALLALAFHAYGDLERAQVTVRNLANGVLRDHAPDQALLDPSTQRPTVAALPTAHWGENGIFYRWSESGVETTAFALKALMAIDPQNELVEPVMNWLVKNRRGAQWSNTRDTAIAILALSDYLKISKELQADAEYEIFVNEQSIAQQKISSANMFQAPRRIEVDARVLRDGANLIRLRKKGKSPLYFSAQAVFFTQEKPIRAAGNEIFIKRQYFKQIARPTLLKGFINENVLLKDGDMVKSGDRLEVVLTIETKNDMEYLVLEDLKPSGFEAVQIQSGKPLWIREMKTSSAQKEFPPQNVIPTSPATPENLMAKTMRRIIPPPNPDDISDFTNRGRSVHQELRDRQAVFFIDKLPQGIWRLSYELRVETPGKFSALPTLGHAMYVPEIRCNGDEITLSVAE